MKIFYIDEVEVRTDIDGIQYDDAKSILETLNSKEEFPIVRLTIRWAQDDNNPMLDCDYEVQPPKFERIRRITGYLTGDLNSWNNAKRAEESERVKHI